MLNAAKVNHLIRGVVQHGLQDLNTYLKFQPLADKIKDNLLSFLIEQKRLSRKVAAYGAAARGNILLNYASVKPYLIKFFYNLAQAKQNKSMPGSHIPTSYSKLNNWSKLDLVVVLTRKIALEVKAQLSAHLKPGAFLVTAFLKFRLSS